MCELYWLDILFDYLTSIKPQSRNFKTEITEFDSIWNSVWIWKNKTDFRAQVVPVRLLVPLCASSFDFACWFSDKPLAVHSTWWKTEEVKLISCPIGGETDALNTPHTHWWSPCCLLVCSTPAPGWWCTERSSVRSWPQRRSLQCTGSCWPSLAVVCLAVWDNRLTDKSLD